MKPRLATPYHSHQGDAHNTDSADVFGFWLYIMTDCILFSTLFSTYLVLSHPTSILPLRPHINLPYVLKETFSLLASNFTFGLAVLSIKKYKLAFLQIWLILTFLLGFNFVFMEVREFIHLVSSGYSWETSGAASAFFTLVATHGIHVSVGLLWILVTIFQLPLLKINALTKKRLIYLGLFWNFLDIVWIFVFTIVYLMEAI